MSYSNQIAKVKREEKKKLSHMNRNNNKIAMNKKKESAFGLDAFFYTKYLQQRKANRIDQMEMLDFVIIIIVIIFL